MSRDHLRKHFVNPPKGGNGRGVPTHDAMSGAGAQHVAVRGNFEEGVSSAKTNALHASRTGQAEFRNYKSNFRPAQLPDDPSGVQAYDHERVSGEVPKAPPPPARVEPVLDPPRVTAPRSDGKPG